MHMEINRKVSVRFGGYFEQSADGEEGLLLNQM